MEEYPIYVGTASTLHLGLSGDKNNTNNKYAYGVGWRFNEQDDYGPESPLTKYRGFIHSQRQD